MLYLNRDFYAPNNIVSFVDTSMQVLLTSNPTIISTKEYWLYYYIREDFWANLYSLYNTDIDLDCIGFSVIHRNTRHLIESFLDLVNLCNDPDYISVLEHNAKKGKSLSKYKSYLQKGYFTILSKFKIATQMYHIDIPKSIMELSSKNNKYIHPNVFVSLLTYRDVNLKIGILKELLNTNLDLFLKSYDCLVKKFNGGTYPHLNCTNCSMYSNRQCSECFSNESVKFSNLINNGLITYTNPTAGNFQP